MKPTRCVYSLGLCKQMWEKCRSNDCCAPIETICCLYGPWPLVGSCYAYFANPYSWLICTHCMSTLVGYTLAFPHKPECSLPTGYGHVAPSISSGFLNKKCCNWQWRVQGERETCAESSGPNDNFGTRRWIRNEKVPGFSISSVLCLAQNHISVEFPKSAADAKFHWNFQKQ